jgi:hypothetical protein
MSNLPNTTDQLTALIDRLPQPKSNLAAEAAEIVTAYATGFAIGFVGIVWIDAVKNICTKWKGFK